MKTEEILNQLWLDFAVVDHTRHILIQVIDFHVLPGKYNQMNRNAISEMNTIHNGRLEAQGSRLSADSRASRKHKCNFKHIVSEEATIE